MANSSGDSELDQLYVDAALELERAGDEVNGDIEAGIAAGCDKSLAEADRLNINVNISQGAAAVNAAAHYLSVRYAGHSAAEVSLGIAEQFLVLAAFYIINCNLLCTYGEGSEETRKIDGDVIRVTKSSKRGAEFRSKVIATLKSPGFGLDKITVLTIILATKVNWYLTNHHTGSGTMQGFVKKVVEARAKGLEKLSTIVHQAGHWASTLKVCKIMHVRGLKELGEVHCKDRGTPTVYRQIISLSIASDISMRLNENTFPAGTHRTQLAWAGIRMIYSGPLAPLFPDAYAVVSLAEKVDKIKANAAAYHMGARYLTGNPKEVYDDVSESAVLGRVGSYLVYMHKTHTLTSSPHITKGGRRIHEAYSDFDGAWDSLVLAYIKMRVKCKPTAINVVLGVNGNAIPELDSLNNAYVATGNVKMSPDVYAKINRGIQDHLLTPEEEEKEKEKARGKSSSSGEDGSDEHQGTDSGNQERPNPENED